MSPALAGRFSAAEPPAKFGCKAIRTPKYTPLLSLDLSLILDKIHLSHLVFYVSDHFIYFGLAPANQEVQVRNKNGLTEAIIQGDNNIHY